MSRRRFIAATAGALALLAGGEALAAPKRRAKAPAKAAARRGSGGKTKAKATETARETFRAEEVAAAEEARAEAKIVWRRYDLITAFATSASADPVHLWIPLAMTDEPTWQRVGEQSWEGNPDRASISRDPSTGTAVLHAEWRGGGTSPAFRLVQRVETADRQFDITHRNQAAERSDVLRRALRSPGDSGEGIVRSTAERIVGRVRDPVAQAKLIYDWVIDRTRFDTQGTGNGTGDIAAMLERDPASGRCADINGLFVALLRAVGIPARLTWGLRVDQSQIVASLGQRGALVGAEHCRAEFYAPGYAWIPADPADVRKALAEDGASLDRMKESVLRKLLFGFWEMNWVACHRQPVVTLAGARSAPAGALVQPWVEIGGRRPDGGTTRLSVTAARASDRSE